MRLDKYGMARYGIDMDNLITAKELASRLAVDVSTAHRMLRRAKVKPVKRLAAEGSRGQRMSFFDAAIVDRLIKDTYAEGGA